MSSDLRAKNTCEQAVNPHFLTVLSENAAEVTIRGGTIGYLETRQMVDSVRWRILLVALAGWVNRHQLEVIEYLREENRVLKAQVAGRLIIAKTRPS
jgi:hypothetical protein